LANSEYAVNPEYHGIQSQIVCNGMNVDVIYDTIGKCLQTIHECIDWLTERLEVLTTGRQLKETWVAETMNTGDNWEEPLHLRPPPMTDTTRDRQRWTHCFSRGGRGRRCADMAQTLTTRSATTCLTPKAFTWSPVWICATVWTHHAMAASSGAPTRSANPTNVDQIVDRNASFTTSPSKTRSTTTANESIHWPSNAIQTHKSFIWVRDQLSTSRSSELGISCALRLHSPLVNSFTTFTSNLLNEWIAH